MKLLQSILLVALLCFSKAGFAVICLKEGGLSKDSVDIRTTIAVPNDEARGTVLWRSPNYHMLVECKQENWISQGEKVFIYLSPTDQGMTQLGPDIEFGVNLKGVDYTCSSLERCRMEIGETEPCAVLCTNFKTRFSIAYNFFIAKKSTPEQSAHKEGVLAGLSQYDAFQIDGEGGINERPGKNFRMTVTGLNRMRYVGCLAKIALYPSVLDFGPLPMSGARVGDPIAEKSFYIIVGKNCISYYGLSAIIVPTNGRLLDQYTLVPDHNASLGISIYAADGKSPVPFNEEFTVMPPTENVYFTAGFRVRPKWLTEKPTTGPFHAAAVISVYYK